MKYLYTYCHSYSMCQRKNITNQLKKMACLCIHVYVCECISGQKEKKNSNL